MELSKSVCDSRLVDRHIGLRIREERIKRGFSQAELGALIGVTYQQLHKYESGTNRTSASRLFQISNILGIDISELVPTTDIASSSSSVGRQDLDLARNFARITKETHRQSICDLVRILADD